MHRRVNTHKRYLLTVAAFNLSIMMRKLIDAGTQRGCRDPIEGFIGQSMVFKCHILYLQYPATMILITQIDSPLSLWRTAERNFFNGTACENLGIEIPVMQKLIAID